jgi:hypothetical protein
MAPPHYMCIGVSSLCSVKEEMKKVLAYLLIEKTMNLKAGYIRK